MSSIGIYKYCTTTIQSKHRVVMSSKLLVLLQQHRHKEHLLSWSNMDSGPGM